MDVPECVYMLTTLKGRRMKLIMKFFLVLGLFTIGVGCASFRVNELADMGSLPPPSGTGRDAIVSYEFSADVEMGQSRPQPELLRSQLEAEFLEVLLNSGYFYAIDHQIEDADFAMQINILNRGNPAAMLPAFVTGFSLFTIPSWAKDTFILTCQIHTREGVDYFYQLEDASILVQWLPMILAFPFNLPARVPVDIRKNMYRHLLLQMKDDGLL